MASRHIFFAGQMILTGQYLEVGTQLKVGPTAQ
jgi:hypothetical protein